MPLALNARKTIEAYARGQLTLVEAERALKRVIWSGQPTYDATELVGLADIPPPNDNSPDWIQLVPGLSAAARTSFTAIYDRR